MENMYENVGPLVFTSLEYCVTNLINLNLTGSRHRSTVHLHRSRQRCMKRGVIWVSVRSFQFSGKHWLVPDNYNVTSMYVNMGPLVFTCLEYCATNHINLNLTGSRHRSTVHLHRSRQRCMKRGVIWVSVRSFQFSGKHWLVHDNYDVTSMYVNMGPSVFTCLEYCVTNLINSLRPSDAYMRQ